MLVRGFKAWCERVASEQRLKLGLGPLDSLDPHVLAAQMDIRIVGAHEVPGLAPQTLATLTSNGGSSWSAVTVSNGRTQIIILNSSHSDSRSRSDLAHELSHQLIGHAPAKAFVAPDGSLMLDRFDREQEEEANVLAGTLLLPREALLQAVAKGATDADICARYGVSTQMLQYRRRMTGVDKQLGRRSAWHKPAGARANGQRPRLRG